MYIPKFLRDPGAGGSGAGIVDLVNGASGAQKLDEVIQQTDAEKAEQEALAKEATNEDGTLKDGYEKDANGKITKKEAAPAETEGLNEDGTLKEGYIKDAEGKVVKDPDYKPADEGDENEEGNFWEAVDKITGRTIELKYPEGVDITTEEGQAWATSPEGVAFRLNAEREAGAMDFEKYLQTTNPRAYAFMLHLDAGGTEEDFFNDNRGYQLPTQEELAGSADVQASLYKYDLLSRGLDEDAAQALVDKAIKDNKLKERSEAAWKTLDQAQKDQLKTLQEKTDAQNKKFNDDLATFTKSVQDQIKSQLGFVVPDAQQGQFEKFVMDNIRYDNGKFFIVQEIGQDPKSQLESLFFQFKKGDLKSLVQRQAKTQAAQGMRLKLGSNNKGPGQGSGTGKSQTQHLPLSSILPTT